MNPKNLNKDLLLEVDSDSSLSLKSDLDDIKSSTLNPCISISSVSNISKIDVEV